MPGTFQIGGVISGLDTAKIIEQLMAVERRPLKALESQQQRVKDRRAALAELSTKLSALRMKALNIILSSTNKARAATSSNTNVATVSANSTAAIQSFDLQVVQMATRTTVSSPLPIGKPIDGLATLNNAGFSTTPASGTFSINGVQFSVNAATDRLDDPGVFDPTTDVLDRINDPAGPLGGSIQATLVGNTIKLETVSGGAGQSIVLGAGSDTSNFLSITKLAASKSVLNGGTGEYENTSTGGLGTINPSVAITSATANFANPVITNPVPPPDGTITINGVAIDYNATDTLNDVITKINASAAKVTASYDPNADTFTLTAKDTGPATINFQDSNGTLLSSLFDPASVGAYPTPTSGKQATYKINNGPDKYSTSNVVSDAVPGVTLTFKDAGTTKIDITQDTATVVGGVKDFVKAFNEALDLVRQQTAVDPSTKTGSILTGDPFVKGIEAKLKNVLNTADTSLTGTYTELPRLGLTSGAVGSVPGSTNSMVLDEAKLTQALQQDPDGVAALLGSPTGPLATLNSFLLGATLPTGPLGESQKAADRLLSDVDSRTRVLQDRFARRQAQLEKKFADLEAAMARLQAQSAQLSSQLGQLTQTSFGSSR